jgi:hypothetical protein
MISVVVPKGHGVHALFALVAENVPL